MDDKTKKRGRRLALVAVGAAATALGAYAASKVAEKAANKACETRSPTADIDFDDMGPEIVRTEKPEEE